MKGGGGGVGRGGGVHCIRPISDEGHWRYGRRLTHFSIRHLAWRLQDEWDYGRAQGRVIPELLYVAAVFAFGPYSHLDEAHDGEEGDGNTLGHYREAQPGAKL